MVSAPRGRGEPSLSQTTGCKSSVVAMKTVSAKKEADSNSSIFQSIHEDQESIEIPPTHQQTENAVREEKAESVDNSPLLQTRPIISTPNQKSSIALPLPEVTEVPATPDSDRLFPR